MTHLSQGTGLHYFGLLQAWILQTDLTTFDHWQLCNYYD